MFYGMKNLLKTALQPQILKKIQTISAFKELWEVSKEAERDASAGLVRTTIITSAGASTRIEGAKLSDDEIIARLKDLKIQRIHDRDEAEVAGYIDCLHHIFDHFREIEITEHTIRSLHQMMCAYLASDVLPQGQRGAYKNVSNAVVRVDHETGGREVIFETTPPGVQTDIAMRELVEDYNAFIRDPNYSDLEVIAAFIVAFLAIHPFRDGNGRMARLLTNLMLLRCGYAFCMYSSHEKVVEDNKEAYYVALRQTQATLTGNADLNPWFLFFLSALEQQVNILQGRVVLRHAGTLTLLSEKVLDLIRAHQPASIGFLQRASGIKRATLKAILARLKKDGTITMDGSKKGSLYRIR
jgi:Fic family protein